MYVPQQTQASCGNQGLQWSFYNNTQGSNPSNGYAQFDPTVYKSQIPFYNSTTTSVGGINIGTTSQLVSLYGSPTFFNSTFFTLNHRGYFFADTTGQYNFSVSGVDDIAFVWIGQYAYSGWTRSNANFVAGYASAPGANYTLFSATAGNYYPFRIVFGQAQGAIIFNLLATYPNGSNLLSSSNSQSQDILQYGCPPNSQQAAPAYPNWGSET